MERCRSPPAIVSCASSATRFFSCERVQPFVREHCDIRALEHAAEISAWSRYLQTYNSAARCRAVQCSAGCAVHSCSGLKCQGSAKHNLFCEHGVAITQGLPMLCRNDRRHGCKVWQSHVNSSFSFFLSQPQESTSHGPKSTRASTSGTRSRHQKRGTARIRSRVVERLQWYQSLTVNLACCPSAASTTREATMGSSSGSLTGQHARHGSKLRTARLQEPEYSN